MAHASGALCWCATSKYRRERLTVTHCGVVRHCYFFICGMLSRKVVWPADGVSVAHHAGAPQIIYRFSIPSFFSLTARDRTARTHPWPSDPVSLSSGQHIHVLLSSPSLAAMASLLHATRVFLGLPAQSSSSSASQRHGPPASPHHSRRH